ncbi:cupin domain-containing protein [Vibrio ruber]|uniref:JmjC domain-containing protein n=1 Tax=Vibrio ruber TaxID=184755 RepID=UPI0028932E43|nr:cupin domain-containing protein [Vibrio ruber]WNJ97539.1 cupin domain-containing protein [Vibrio ruber]
MSDIFSDLFPKIGRSEFIDRYWPNTYYYENGELQRLNTFIHELLDIQPTTLLDILECEVDVLSNDGSRYSFVSAKDSKPFYDQAESMIYIKDLSQFSCINTMISQLSDAIGIDRKYIYCEGFLAKKGVRVDTHFDHETNFMIQLTGEKDWQVAINNDLPNPLKAFFVNNPNRFYDHGKHPYTGERLPSEMPIDHQSFVVYPGTVTYLPRGYWHNTYTHSDSFSIGIVIDPPTNIELFTSVLKSNLLKSELARKHPLYKPNSEHQFDNDINKLKKEIINEINNISSKDLYQYLNKN